MSAPCTRRLVSARRPLTLLVLAMFALMLFGPGMASSASAASDIATSISSPDGDFAVDEQDTLDVALTNFGPDPATAPASVSIALPAGVTFVSSGGAGWTCTPGASVTCTNTTSVGPGLSYPVLGLVVTANASAVPGVAFTATTSYPGDPNGANNTGTVAVGVRPQVDFSVTLPTAIGTAKAGVQLAIKATVINKGAANPEGTTTVTDTLPAGFTFVSASASGGTSQWICATSPVSAQQIVCSTSNYSDGYTTSSNTSTITILVMPQQAAAGTVTNTVSVAAAGDGYGANDSASQVYKVTGLADQAMQLTVSPNWLVGQNATITALLVHSGQPMTDLNTTVTVSVPPAVTVRSAGGAGWSCTVGQPISCATGSPVFGGISVAVTPTAAAIPSVPLAALLSNASDPIPDNNSASLAVPVGPGTQAGFTAKLRVTRLAKTKGKKKGKRKKPAYGHLAGFTVKGLSTGSKLVVHCSPQCGKGVNKAHSSATGKPMKVTFKKAVQVKKATKLVLTQTLAGYRPYAHTFTFAPGKKGAVKIIESIRPG